MNTKIRDIINERIKYRKVIENSCKCCKYFAEESHCYGFEFDEGIVLNVEEDCVCDNFEMKDDHE